MQKRTTVKLSDDVKKAIRKREIPQEIFASLTRWVDAVTSQGILEARKCGGFHDEPIKGSEIGRRSVRLSKGWRLFYVMNDDGECHILLVLEINKHVYR